MKRIVIGMTAHVDSGKTTLSEAMLYCCGEIRKLGRVDHRDAFLDTHDIERQRGITVFSKQAVIHRDDNIYTLLDTPGHADFSAEAERAFSVMDMAILVISGIDGVQSHTETLWRLLGRYKIPVFVFVNKMDITNLDKDYLLRQLQGRLSGKIADFSPTLPREVLCESIADLSENMMNEFLDNGDINDDTIAQDIAGCNVFPCFFGSALKLKGIEELLNAVDRYAPSPEYSDEFGARVYKITNENNMRLTHMKITGGSLKVRGTVGGSEKVNQIRIYSGAKYSSPETVQAGTLCAVTGLSDTYAGQGLGIEKNSAAPLLEPVLSYRIDLPSGIDARNALELFRQLEEEDPLLHIIWNERLQEIHAALMGEIQLEVLSSQIKERFGFDVTFDSGSISYKETIAAASIGMGHYEPLRHYAEVHLLLEPLESGSGLVFAADCSEDVLDRNWQRLVMTHLEEKTHIGVLTGSPVTDMKITLVTGRAHLKHTEGGDFRQATYRAVRMGLRSAQSVLLEPWYSFELLIPSECTGRAMNDLQQMQCDFSSPEMDGEFMIITGSGPVSEMSGYHTELAGYTKGKGRLGTVLKGYFPCHNADEVIAKIGYDADADVDNSADSVFCAHGAGFVVKWDEVRSHMHMDSGIRLAGDKSEDVSETYVPRGTYDSGKSFADDKELTAIFERTYGKIQRDERSAMRRVNEPSYEKYKAKPMPKGPWYLLVDGYNIIFSWDELKKTAADNLDLARSQLINILSNYQGFKQCRVIAVFDAYKVKGSHREVETVGGVSVIYTKEAETADMYIEKASHELAKEYKVRVATSDGAEQIIILGNGAYRMSAGELYEEVKAAEKEIRNIIEKPSAEKHTRHEIKGGG